MAFATIVVILFTRHERAAVGGEAWGHRVEEAENGEQGLALLRTSAADVALIDLGLPAWTAMLSRERRGPTPACAGSSSSR